MTSNSQSLAQPLADLRDIHLPSPISWWPIATGWYFLAVIVLVLLFTGIFFLHQRHSHRRAKCQALQLLANYEQQYQQDNNSPLMSAKISELLRRVALVYFPRKEVASLNGDEWIDFLNKTSKNINFNTVRECLLELPYQNNARGINLKPLFSSAHAWIKQRGVPCSN